MKSIYLVRHCKADGQESDAKLTDEGAFQSDKLVDFFMGRSVQYIVSSPFKRAVSTIQPLAKRLGLDIHIDDRLSERILSADLLSDWMDKLRNSFFDMDLRLSGGESSREATNRGLSLIREVMESTGE